MKWRTQRDDWCNVGRAVYCWFSVDFDLYGGRKMVINTDALYRARETYGEDKQLAVVIEELAELSAVLAKYYRYDDKDKAVAELSADVIGEVADVYIVLEHVKSIFNLSDEAVELSAFYKTERLERWLRASDSIEQTLIDRGLDG